MAYMKRRERRAEILDAVVLLAGTEGFAAATIRRIASELNMAVGGIHHIFSSSAELKREAFRSFAQQAFAGMDATSVGSTTERLLPYLCAPHDAAEVSGVLMWREALNEATRDAAFAEVYAEAMQIWSTRIIDVLREELRHVDQSALEALAWRLMALSSGLAGLSQVAQLPALAGDAIGHIRHILDVELQQLRAPPA